MRNFVLLLAFLLNCSTSSGAFLVPAQSSKRNLPEPDTAPAASWRIDGNRTFETVDSGQNDDEERHPTNEIANELKSFSKAVGAEEQLSQKIHGSPVAEKEVSSYMTRWMKAFNKKLNAILKDQHLKQFEELQELLGSTPQPTDYYKAALCGYTPFFWKTMIDSQGLISAHEQAELVRLREYTTFYTKLLNNPGAFPHEDHIIYKAIFSLTSSQKKKRASLISEIVKIIDKGLSVKQLLLNDISPGIYNEAVMFDKRLSFPSNRKNQNQESDSSDKNALRLNLIHELSVYRSEYAKKLQGLIDEIQK